MSEPLIRLPTVASTNDWLKVRGQGGAPHGTAVVAEVQTAGRGRLGRSWSSARGNLHLSVLLRPRITLERAPLLCLAAAVAIVDACNVKTGIKWPNDVLAPNGKKLAGVLAEVEGSAARVDFVVVGVGMNVLQTPNLPSATSLLELDGKTRDVAELAARIRENLLFECEVLEGSAEGLLARWRQRNITLGKRVCVGDVDGIAEDVDSSGSLLVRGEDGRLHRVLSGDVSILDAG